MKYNKIGRNDPCLCGSGLKYKKCCLKSKKTVTEDLRLKCLQTELKQKIKIGLDQEVVFLEADSQLIKMSEIILEFAEDVLRHASTRSEKRKAIDLACLAWNLSLVKEKSDEEYKIQLNFFLQQMGLENQTDRNDIEPLIDALVDKKLNEYSAINRFIVNYQIDFQKDELMLNVASIILQAEIDEIARGR